MFDLAIIHSVGLADGKHDLGQVLEAMLYYDRVHIVMGAQLFTGLWDILPPDDFAALLGHPSITTTMTPEMVGIHTETGNGISTYSPIAMRMSGRDRKIIAEHDDVGSLLQLISGNPNRKKASRGEVGKVVKFARKSRYAKILGGGKESYDRFKSLARDPETLKLFLRGRAEAQGRVVDEGAFRRLEVDVLEHGDRILISSSEGLSKVVSGWDDQAEWGQILNSLQGYAIDLYLSSNLSGDIIASSEIGQVAAARVDLTIQRATRSAAQISAFEEMVFEEQHAFGQAFNAGLIDLTAALKIIDQSRKFRAWTHALPPDANLLAEYHRAISRETALSGLPFKLARFGIFNFGGMAADTALPGSGAGLSAIDTFIFDSVLGGWRPNVFVRKLQRSLDKAKQKSIDRDD